MDDTAPRGMKQFSIQFWTSGSGYNDPGILLKSCIDESDKPTTAQTHADQVEVDFKTNAGAQGLLEAVHKRLARGDINDLTVSVPQSQLHALDDLDSEDTLVLPRHKLIDPDREVAGHQFEDAEVVHREFRDATNPFAGLEDA